MTKPTGWDTGLCQDYHRGLALWFASRLDARHTIRRWFGEQRKTMDPHLKPCPHCGSEAKFNTITDDPESPDHRGNYIACEACGATTQLMFSTGEDCRPMLAELWNARHTPTNKAPDSMLKFSGTPTEIGGQIWERMCLPAVGKVSRELTPIATAQLYGGFTMAAWGAMVADFGHVQAIDFARQMLARFEKEAPTLTEDGTTGTH